jgi:hydrogenase expression/formation protein HypE
MVEERPFGLLLKETLLPFSPGARAVAELLGIDPLQVASEGRLVLVCDPAATESILALWRAMPEGRGAVRIGEVTGPAGRVVMETVTGGRRLVDVPRGELLPRIC